MIFTHIPFYLDHVRKQTEYENVIFLRSLIFLCTVFLCLGAYSTVAGKNILVFFSDLVIIGLRIAKVNDFFY